MKKNNRPGAGRIFRSGLYSTAILTAAVVLAVLVNLAVRTIPARYTEFDLSEGGLYTLGETSRQLAGELGQDVTIYYLCETGSEDAIITGLLDQYAAAGGRIRWEQIRFDGEGQITEALYRLTSGEPSRAYATSNHGEKALSAALTDALEAQNIEVESLSLLSGPVPEDCALLIINCPASDFAGADGPVDETALLQDYLDAGGRVLLLTDAYYSTPNLDAVMAGFGLTRVEGLVVEGDADRCLYGYSYYLLPALATGAQEVVESLDPAAPVLLQTAQGLAAAPADGVAAVPLLTTSDAAYSKTAGYEMTTVEREEGDLDGPFDLAVWAEADRTGAAVVWVGCSNMDDDLLYQSIPGNCDFLVGCAAALTGQSGGLLIESKALEADQLVLPARTAAAVGLTFLAVIPVGLLAAGAVVTIRRRRR